MVEEAVVGLAGKRFASAEWSRYHDSITLCGKCFGEEAMRVMCDAAVRPHISAEQEANCKALGSWVRSRHPDALAPNVVVCRRSRRTTC
jgi:hypothetical protein